MDNTGNKDIIEAFYALVKKAFLTIAGAAKEMDEATAKADFAADGTTTLLIVLISLALLGSAFWAASIASARRYNPFLHFFLGLLLPWIWPLFMLFCFDLKGEKARRAAMAAESQAKAEAEAQRQKDLSATLGVDAPAKSETAEEGFTPKYFESIARREDGKKAGPWEAGFNGITLHVLTIEEVLPQVVKVNFMDEKAHVSQMRLPYARIEYWQDGQYTEADLAAMEELRRRETDSLAAELEKHRNLKQ